jgi:hypothetical protein
MATATRRYAPLSAYDMALDLNKYKLATPSASPGGIDLSKYKIAPPAPPPKPEIGGIGKSAMGVLSGIVKRTTSTFQNLGNLLAKPIAAGIDKVSLPAGQPARPVGFDEDQLALKTPQEKAGGFVSDAATLLLPQSKIATATKGLSLLPKLALRAGADTAVVGAQTKDPLAAGLTGGLSLAGRAVLPIKKALSSTPAADALEVTTRTFNKKATVGALERSGQPGGFAEKKTGLGKLLGQTEYVPNQKDISVAKSVEDVVSKSASPVKNIEAINGKISHVSENVVTPLLEANPGAFNRATYNATLKTIEPPDYVKTDAVLEKTYDLVRQRFVDIAGKHPGTKLGLWNARKEIDHVLEEQFGRGVFDPEKYSVYQRAVTDMRRATNDFINEGTDDAFKANMRAMSDMFEARSRIALDNYRIANSNRFSRWMAENPGKTKAIELILGAGAAVGIGKAALD